MTDILLRTHMTASEAKALGIRVWTYLAEHPEISKKAALPKDLMDIIDPMVGSCPLCAFFDQAHKDEKPGIRLQDCHALCPIGTVKGAMCGRVGSPYYRWQDATFLAGALDGTDDPEHIKGIRRKAANEIVELISAWKVDE